MKHIAITGAGLVGSLLAIYLRKRGYEISVFERRPDLREQTIDGGRSINLALSNRGLKALEEIGLSTKVEQIAIPMHGRIMHALNGELTSQPYGKEGEFIRSISRGALNELLVDIAEKAGVKFYFNKRILQVDLENTRLTYLDNDTPASQNFGAIVGADGAFSAVRAALQMTDRFDFSQDYIEHGYKELHIPAGNSGAFKLEKNALHIWPRQSFMMIALPNPDGSFTCTLFFPFQGSCSFSSLNADQYIEEFFKVNFPDAIALMPHLLEDFKNNPTSSLVTIKCFPWFRHSTLLIGDAAHAIVPFYGQGMNAGFDDCRILNEMLDRYDDDWSKSIEAFCQWRKPDTDAVATLALDNFIEMRDLVGDADFLLRKKIEAKLHALYPEKWIPLYSMVTFHQHIRYADAYRIGKKQQLIMDKVMKTPNIETTWESLNFEQLVHQIQAT